MISRKPGFFINYLRENKEALFNTFQSVKKKDDEIVHSLILTNPVRSPLTQETFYSIQKIYDTKDNSVPLSSEEFKEIFDVITKKGFSELFNYEHPLTKEVILSLFSRHVILIKYESTKEVFNVKTSKKIYPRVQARSC